jgi:hypothetical protein
MSYDLNGSVNPKSLIYCERGMYLAIVNVDWFQIIAVGHDLT